MVFTRRLLGLSLLVGCATIRTMATASASAIGGRVSLGAGCYWGTEKFVKKEFPYSTGAVGFMHQSPQAKANPTYKEVCSGKTGYVEVYDVDLGKEASEESFRRLIRHFFSIHDPTTIDRQGNDRGTQYASAIFYYDEHQKRIAQEVAREVQTLLDSQAITAYEGPNVTTAILPATKFFPAHEEHQEYLDKNPGGYCNHSIRFRWKD